MDAVGQIDNSTGEENAMSDWTGSATLEDLRNLDTIVYRVFTVIQETGGVDGSLQSGDGTVSYPLDLWTPAEREGNMEDLDGHGILTGDEEMSEDIVTHCVSTWCWEYLQRGDVIFEF